MLNLYCVRDRVGDTVICSFSCANDGLAIRENYPALSRVAPIGDLELVQIGTLDEKTLEVNGCPSRVVSWDSYKFPESPIQKGVNPQLNPQKK